MFGQKDFVKQIFFPKQIWVGLTQGGRCLITPSQKIVGLKLYWVVVRIDRLGVIQNFRPLGPLFLVEVKFPVGRGGGGLVG